MDIGEHNLPKGYRFSPTDEELITFYLMRKILNRPQLSKAVKEIELYKHTPEDLEKNYGTRRESEMFFFTRRTLHGTRAARTTTNGGFWKASTRRKPIENANQEIIGYKLLFNYFLAKGKMTTWLMYEYTTPFGAEKMDEFVLCKVYAKKKKEQKLQFNEQLCRYFERQALTYQIDGVGVHEQIRVEPQAQNVPTQADLDQPAQPEEPVGEIPTDEDFAPELEAWLQTPLHADIIQYLAL